VFSVLGVPSVIGVPSVLGVPGVTGVLGVAGHSFAVCTVALAPAFNALIISQNVSKPVAFCVCVCLSCPSVLKWSVTTALSSRV